MKASDKFKKGDRVLWTPEAWGHFYHDRVKRCVGVVTGFGTEPDIVRVKPDNLKTSYAYHVSFWHVWNPEL